MTAFDLLLPGAWWQRVLIVLAVLVFAPVLVAAARLAIAVVRLVLGALGVVVRRRSAAVELECPCGHRVADHDAWGCAGTVATCGCVSSPSEAIEAAKRERP